MKLKKVIILPHSTSKTNILGKFVIRYFLKGVNILYAREELSYNFFRKLLPNINVKLNTDIAFAINNGIEEKRENMVAITTRSQTVGDIGELSVEKNNISKKI